MPNKWFVPKLFYLFILFVCKKVSFIILHLQLFCVFLSTVLTPQIVNLN